MGKFYYYYYVFIYFYYFNIGRLLLDSTTMCKYVHNTESMNNKPVYID